MIGTLIPVLAILIPTVIAAAFKSFRLVPEGEMAILLRFNKAVKKKDQFVIIGPGVRRIRPFVDRVPSTNMGEQTITLAPRDISLACKSVYVVSVNIIYHVENSPKQLHRALCKTPHFERLIAEYGQTIVQKVVPRSSASELSVKEHQKAVAKAMRKRLRRRAEKWGVRIKTMELAISSPTQMTQVVDTVQKTVKSVMTELIPSTPTIQPDINHHNNHSVTLLHHQENGHAK